MNVRRWIDSLLPDAESSTLQLNWLRGITRGDQGLIESIVQSPTARRLLNRRAYRQHKIVIPGRVELAPHQQWLLAGHAEQIALARRLGFDALHENIRKAIRSSSVTALRKELGDEGYKLALATPGIAVRGLEQIHFDAALGRGELAGYAISVGAALLETTTPPGDDFCRLRMQFAFSPECWRKRPRGIKVDPDELTRRIVAAPNG